MISSLIIMSLQSYNIFLLGFNHVLKCPHPGHREHSFELNAVFN